MFKLKDLLLHFKNIKQEIKSMKEVICSKTDTPLNLFYGRQINLLYHNIKIKNEKLNLDLFKAMTNNNIKEIKLANDSIYEVMNKQNDYNTIINEIEEYITDIIGYNKKTINDIYLDNEIKEEYNEYIGIYYYISLNQDIESLFIYQKLTNNLPINSCFLYCTPETTSEELISFLYRSIYCNYNILFCIINCDFLSYFQSRLLINIIKKITKENNKSMKSCLLIMINNKNSDIYLSLVKNKIFQFFYFLNDDEKIIKINDERTMVLVSNNTGFGKSEEIKDLLSNKNSKYIYFPLGGKFNRDKLINKINLLPDMNSEDQKYIVHIDLNRLEEIFLTKEFLFKILILNKYYIYDNVKYFGKNVSFFIEIQNDYINVLNEIKLLSYFNVKSIEKIMTIKESTELTLVSNILSMYESKKIFEKDYNIKSPKISLTKEDVYEIIIKYLKEIDIKNPNFYQINMFIKFLYDELLKFTNYTKYSVNSLKSNAIDMGMTIEETSEIREFLFNSILKSSKLFIFGPYENLIKIMEINNNDRNDNVINKNEIIEDNNEVIDDKEKIINALSLKKNNSLFNINENSLITFNNNGNNAIIISGDSNEKNILKRISNYQNFYLQKSINNNLNKLNNKNNINDNKNILLL